MASIMIKIRKYFGDDLGNDINEVEDYLKTKKIPFTEVVKNFVEYLDDNGIKQVREEGQTIIKSEKSLYEILSVDDGVTVHSANVTNLKEDE